MQDFQKIEHLIPNFADRVDDPPAPNRDQNTLSDIFEDLLGQSAQFIQPVLFRSGQLHVYTEAAVWGHHIQHRQERILQCCQAKGLLVNEIKVKVRPGSILSATQEQKRPVSYDVKFARQTLDRFSKQIKDEALKQTVEQLASRIRKNHPNDL